MDCSSFSSSSVSVRFLGAEGPGRDMLAVAVFTEMSTTAVCQGERWAISGASMVLARLRGRFGGVPTAAATTAAEWVVPEAVTDPL